MVNNHRKQRETKKSALDPTGDWKVPGSNLGEFDCSSDMIGATLVGWHDITSLVCEPKRVGRNEHF
jgi:hypothetical protein